MRTFLILAVAASGLAGGAGAQIVHTTQERMTTPGPQPLDDTQRSDKLFRHTLVCVAEREPSRVKSLLAKAPGSEGEARLASTFQSRLDFCIPGPQSISFSWALLRGGFAEVLYHQQFPNGLGADAPVEAATAWAEPWLNRGGDQSLELLHSAARCVVVSHPERVTALLATEPLSAAEGQVMGEVQKLFGPCLFSGMKLTSNNQSLRGLLAEAALAYGIGQRDGFQTPKGVAARK